MHDVVSRQDGDVASRPPATGQVARVVISEDTWKANTMDQRSYVQLREHYEIEKELGDRLRRASKQERGSLYNTVYDERCVRIPQHPLVTRAADPIAQARAVAPQLRLLRRFILPDSTFMEVGPGDCALAVAVAPFVRQVYAVDISEGLATGRARPANFEFRLSDGISVPVEPASIDIAFSNQVMEHLHPDDALDQLRGIHAALMSGGRYICITPNPLSGPHDVSRFFDEVATGLHLKEYTITELARAFKQAGFAQVKTFISYHGYVLSPLLPIAPFSILEMLLARVPRRLRKRLAYVLTAVKLVGIR